MTQDTRRRRIRARTLPYPTLLISESAEEFESIRAALEEQIQPRGIIEEKYVEDMAISA